MPYTQNTNPGFSPNETHMANADQDSIAYRPRVIVSVINDLSTDQRVARSCDVLTELGYEVLLVGREQKSSQPLAPRAYACKRMKLLFEQGPQFYFFFNLRLFFVLLFRKADLLLANDLDTLGPNYLVSKLKGIPLVYDSHEIFCEVPELQANPAKKRIWERLEKRIVPKLKYCITVNESIAAYFKEKYKVPFIAVRNIPDYRKPDHIKNRKDLGLSEDRKIIILQGAGINVQRGSEELVEAFRYLDHRYLLLIIGSGDVIPQLKEDVKRFELQYSVSFIPKMPALELRQYTLNVDLGVTIDKDTNLNYHFSLPNKVFDYMHAGIPVLASRLPEIERLVKAHNIGTFIENHDPEHIASQIEAFLNSEAYAICKQNTLQAANQNNWPQEKQKLITLFNEIRNL
jgi:glycosyltransferase involved in cell wall biosynthesis